MGLYAIAERAHPGRVRLPLCLRSGPQPHRTAEAWSKSAIRANPPESPLYRRVRMGTPTPRGADRRRRRSGRPSEQDGVDTTIRLGSLKRDHPSAPGLTRLVRTGGSRLSASRGTAGRSKPPASERPYVLRRLLRCGVCRRRMQGNLNHGEAYYRCRFPAEYALANRIEHHRTVYVREAEIVPRLDEWGSPRCSSVRSWTRPCSSSLRPRGHRPPRRRGSACRFSNPFHPSIEGRYTAP